MEIKHFFMADEMETVDLGEGVTRRILSYNDNIMVCEVHFKKGAVGKVHAHPHEQCSYVLDGVFSSTIGDETRIIKKGDTVYEEPNVMHGAVCLEEGTLLDIFTPCRKDFLK